MEPSVQDSSPDIADQVRSFILENLLFTDDSSAINDDESLLDKGIIDSTGIMEVIMFIEERFGIQVQDEEMIPENLDSVNNIAAFVARKTSD